MRRSVPLAVLHKYVVCTRTQIPGPGVVCHVLYLYVFDGRSRTQAAAATHSRAYRSIMYYTPFSCHIQAYDARARASGMHLSASAREMIAETVL